MASRWRLDLISDFKIPRNVTIRLVGMLAESGKLEVIKSLRSWGEFAEDVAALLHLRAQPKVVSAVA